LRLGANLRGRFSDFYDADLRSIFGHIKPRDEALRNGCAFHAPAPRRAIASIVQWTG
jgi:hypothetical protein